MTTRAIVRTIREKNYEENILTKTVLMTSQSESQIKEILAQLEKQFTVAFLDSKFCSISRTGEGFLVEYRGLRIYEIVFSNLKVEPEDVKMFASIDEVQGTVL